MSVATTIAPTANSRLVSTELLKLIGNTPLIRMERIARDDKSCLFIALVGVPTGDAVGLFRERACHVLALWTSSDLVAWKTSGFLLRDAARRCRCGSCPCPAACPATAPPRWECRRR